MTDSVCVCGGLVFISLEFDLGVRVHNGKRIDSVELPAWADGPDDFIQKHRQALVGTILLYWYHLHISGIRICFTASQ